jgi:hypothetical protein
MPAELLPHHRSSLDAFLAKVRDDPGVDAVILGGSLAKGTFRPDSDVDLIVVLDEERYRAQVARGVLSECPRDGITYAGGYFDLKYTSRSVLEAAAERGSEPTRNAYVAARVVHARVADLDPLLARVAAYPEHERADRIAAFHAGMQLNCWYFWHMARKTGDRYLLVRAAGDIVLYGLRMVLAHNRVLFPCHKGLMAAVASCPERPDGILACAHRLLEGFADVDKQAFQQAIVGWRDWGIAGDVLTRFIHDHEHWWMHRGPFLSEW